jgi:hypothetical protein
LKINSFLHTHCTHSCDAVRGNRLSIKCAVPHFGTPWIALWFWESLAWEYQSLVHWGNQGGMHRVVVHFLHNWLFAQDLALPDNIESGSNFSFGGFFGRGQRSLSLRDWSSTCKCAWALFELWDWLLGNYLGSHCGLFLRLQENLTLGAQWTPLKARFCDGGLSDERTKLSSRTCLLTW